MTLSKGPNHVVVDGSNIATEGRSLPSLAQLSEAVMAFMEEFPDTSITVVVDATFGHRIDKKEVKEFEEGISNNELVAPPAGAVGRGDAFVLSIAQKANASILSNDSFQEFHGDYEWLFDEGRLIGGKPVPHVGWVFVERLPVRGPVSRKATGSSRGGSKRGAKRESDGGRSGRKASPAAMEPMPVPKSPPPRRAATTEPTVEAVRPEESTSSRDQRKRTASPKTGDVVNELMPFLEFVEHHPVGTSVNGTVESYSSHGAYISIGENGVRGYVPLRLMADPPPPSARKVMQIGESVTLVVVSFAPIRRSIDCAMPDMADAAISDAKAELAAGAVAERAAAHADSTPASTTDTTGKKAAAKKAATKPAPAAKKAASKKAPAAKKAAAKKAPVAKNASPERKTATNVTKSVAKPAPASDRSAEHRAPSEKVTAKKAPVAKKAAAKKAPAVKKAAAKKAPVVKNAAAKKAPVVKKAAAKKAPVVKNAAAKKAPAAKKAAATQEPAKKVPARRAAETKASPPVKSAAKKAAAKKAAASSGRGG